MKKKNVKLSEFKITLRKNNFVDGIVIKRWLTLRECRHVMKNILGIVISEKDDFEDNIEYREYNDSLYNDVNGWLMGDFDDSIIMDYAYDCSDEPIGIFNCI